MGLIRPGSISARREMLVGGVALFVGVVPAAAVAYCNREVLDWSHTGVIASLMLSYAVVGGVALVHGWFRLAKRSERAFAVGILVALIGAVAAAVVSALGASMLVTNPESGGVVAGVGYACFAGFVSLWITLRTLEPDDADSSGLANPGVNPTTPCELDSGRERA